MKEVRHCGACTAKCGAQDRTAMFDAPDLSGSVRGTGMGMECHDVSDDAWWHWHVEQEQQPRNQERGYFYECPNGCHRTPWHPHMQECE